MTKKLYRSVTMRALSTMLIGALIIVFPTNTTQYMVMTIGVLFAVPGLLSIISYLRQHKKITDTKNIGNNTDNNKKTSAKTTAMFPLIGLGSVLFGLILLFFPGVFQKALFYLLGLFLVVAGIAQIFSLFRLSKAYKISFVPFIISMLITLAGAGVAFTNYIDSTDKNVTTPESTATPLAAIIFGVASIVYGIVEIIYALYFRNPEPKETKMKQAIEPHLSNTDQ
ncbi:MAG: DUF308 domain-containing protein [Prevotellaceae bacterium]|nr:DUF308 domain-containing protein [Prevotellaceae bacterium]